MIIIIIFFDFIFFWMMMGGGVMFVVVGFGGWGVCDFTSYGIYLYVYIY